MLSRNCLDWIGVASILRLERRAPVDAVSGWWLDAPAKAEIDRILAATISDPVGPEFMAPAARSFAAA